MPEVWLRNPLVRWLSAAVLVAAIIAMGVMLGVQMTVLALAAAALLAVIWLIWSSLQSLTGEAPLTLEEALTLGAPPAEEEQKRAILRALKDLEYERSVGKLSAQDYAELSARYRAEAKRLIARIDERSAPARKQIEGLVAERLASSGVLPTSERPDAMPPDHRSEPAPLRDADPESAAADERAGAADEAPARTVASASNSKVTRRCASCGTRNELDALFCKRCGKAQLGDGQRLCRACPSIYEDELDQCPQCGVAAAEAE
jgi:hypothetical protein